MHKNGSKISKYKKIDILDFKISILDIDVRLSLIFDIYRSIILLFFLHSIYQHFSEIKNLHVEIKFNYFFLYIYSHKRKTLSLCWLSLGWRRIGKFIALRVLQIWLQNTKNGPNAAETRIFILFSLQLAKILILNTHRITINELRFSLARGHNDPFHRYMEKNLELEAEHKKRKKN